MNCNLLTTQYPVLEYCSVTRVGSRQKGTGQSAQ